MRSRSDFERGTDEFDERTVLTNFGRAANLHGRVRGQRLQQAEPREVLSLNERIEEVALQWSMRRVLFSQRVGTA